MKRWIVKPADIARVRCWIMIHFLDFQLRLSRGWGKGKEKIYHDPAEPLGIVQFLITITIEQIMVSWFPVNCCWAHIRGWSRHVTPRSRQSAGWRRQSAVGRGGSPSSCALSRYGIRIICGPLSLFSYTIYTRRACFIQMLARRVMKKKRSLT